MKMNDLESYSQDFYLCPAGTFMMGDSPVESSEHTNSASRNRFSRTRHEVTISSFYIGRHFVTQQIYKAVMMDNPSHYSFNPSNPAEMVSWFDAVSFCNKLSDLFGFSAVYSIEPRLTIDYQKDGFRLPTEAEWEYAARAGNSDVLFPPPLDQDMSKTTLSSRRFYEKVRQLDSDSQNQNTRSFGWHGLFGMRDGNGTARHEHTYPIDSATPNQWGIDQMCGNVREWCCDTFHPDIYTTRNGVSSQDPLVLDEWESTGLLTPRTVRGGSFLTSLHSCRVSSRFGVNPHRRYRDLGFRVARNI